MSSRLGLLNWAKLFGALGRSPSREFAASVGRTNALKTAKLVGAGFDLFQIFVMTFKFPSGSGCRDEAVFEFSERLDYAEQSGDGSLQS